MHTYPGKLSTENIALAKPNEFENTGSAFYNMDRKHFDNEAFRDDVMLINFNAQECTQTFLSPVVVAFSNFARIVLREHI